jgi:hypothetical protein
MISIDVDEFVTELAVSIVCSLGQKLATPLRTLKDRRVRDDLELATWLNTYKLIEPIPLGLPPCPRECTEADLDELLKRDDVHAVLYELLAARLSDAPQLDIGRLRAAMQRIDIARVNTWPTEYLGALFDAFDRILSGVASRLEKERPRDLMQIRAQAHTARIAALLGAIERHVEVLAGETDPTAERDFLDGYRRHLIDLYGVIQPPDFNQRRRVPVDDLYVSPGMVKVDDSERDRIGTSPMYVDIWELADQIDRVVLLGDPGCGKTTASRVLMHYCAIESRRNTPFLVTLREFAAEDPPARSVVAHLEHDLEVRLQHPAPARLLHRLLLNGAATVVFDGLDELLDPARRCEVSAIIEHFCAEYPLARVLVTSRVVGYDQARLDERQFTQYRIYGFDDDQVHEYASKWFAQQQELTSHESQQWADAFFAESEAVSDLRSNPLLLSLMCILYRGEGSIPRNRCDVYERCADLLFRRWDTHRRIHVRLAVARDSDSAVRRILRHLAYWLLTRDVAQTAVTEKQLVAETVKYLTQRALAVGDDEAREAAVEFVAFCRGRAWVFTDVGTTVDGEDLYTFTHRTFLEYFAAQYISASYDTPEQLSRALAPRIANEEWPVVAVLALQIKDESVDRGAERALAALLDEKRKRSVLARTRILSFIAECLPWAPLPSNAVRRLTTEIVERTMSFTRDERGKHAHALALLTTSCWLVRDVVREVILEQIDELCASTEGERRIDGIRLTVNLPLGDWQLVNRPLNRRQQSQTMKNYWEAVVRECIGARMDAAISAAKSDSGILCALAYHSIVGDLAGLIVAMPDIRVCFSSGDLGIYDSRYIPLAASLAIDCLRSSLEEREKRALVALTSELVAKGPSVYGRSVSFQITHAEFAGDDRVNLELFLPCALIVALSVEVRTDARTFEVAEENLNPLDPFVKYVEARLGVRADPDLLPELPMPEIWQDVFTAWARGKYNFSGNSEA